MLCDLCNIEAATSFHHLIPRTTHGNKWFKKRFTRQEMQQGMNVCRGCHKSMHTLIPSEKELGKDFNTKEKLLAHGGIAKYVAWKQRQQRNRE